MYGGARNNQEFLQKLQKKIKKDPPEINISDICDQFYNRSPFCGSPPESNKLIFRNALNRENEDSFGPFNKKLKEVETPVFRMTNDSNLRFKSSSPMKVIKEEQEDSLGKFSLHRYTLP